MNTNLNNQKNIFNQTLSLKEKISKYWSIAKRQKFSKFIIE